MGEHSLLNEKCYRCPQLVYLVKSTPIQLALAYPLLGYLSEGREVHG